MVFSTLTRFLLTEGGVIKVSAIKAKMWDFLVNILHVGA